ncbi:hypothetical protein AgCh_013948 [Apium graveolens]
MWACRLTQRTYFEYEKLRWQPKDCEMENFTGSKFLRRKWTRDHPFELIIGDASSRVETRKATQEECLYSSFLSQEEPKKVREALLDPDWVLAMYEELNQFERNKVWKLVPKPKSKNSIDTKWVFRNKMDENGIVVRNKARLFYKGYCQ